MGGPNLIFISKFRKIKALDRPEIRISLSLVPSFLATHSFGQIQMAKKTHEENHVELELEEEEEEEIVVDEEEEVEKLEAEVNEMAQKILNYRTTLPDQLKSTLASILVSQRPVIGTNLDSVPESQPGTSNVPYPGIFLGFLIFPICVSCRLKTKNFPFSYFFVSVQRELKWKLRIPENFCPSPPPSTCV